MSHVSMKAARRATRIIPIVMAALNYDPIALGYVQSLARPGGNITGLVYRGVDTAPKQLELLREALPAGATVAVLWDAQAARRPGARPGGGVDILGGEAAQG
jgi:putative tryptophan/tyrosine transport system substrate-binding protein